MAKIANPVLFSRHFNIDPLSLEEAGLINPFIDVDTQLFIDPVLLEKSSDLRISNDALDAFRNHFENLVRLLAMSESEGDVAWRGAQRLLDLTEPAESGLGYGGSGRSGSSRPSQIREKILRTTQEIINLGVRDPEMISLMGFFEEDVGPDTISDLTTRVILEQLAAITEGFCNSVGIPVFESDLVNESKLPKLEKPTGKQTSLVLIPRDIVRDLPVANDWSEIEEAAFQNQQIRDRVNTLIGNLVKPTVADRKAALRLAALESVGAFEHFLESVKEHVTYYDPNIDALGYYKLKAILGEEFDGISTDKIYPIASGPEEIKNLVLDTIDLFKHHVENGNLWEELWIGDKPKKERAAQLIYYAIADSYCRAHNVDISPEANMGGGPVDFKFSDGYKARVVVEMKRSSGTVRHGYEKQLEIYKNAANTEFGVFVVMNFGDLGQKLTQIQAIRNQRLRAGEAASEIIVIDATKKKSASKR